MSNIALDTYEVRVEITGVQSAGYQVILDSNNKKDTTDLLLDKDKDTIVTGHEIYRVSENNRLKYNVYPNPANDRVYLMLGSGSQKEIRVHLRDPLGRTVITRDVSQEQGTNLVRFDVSAVENGLYIIQITDCGEEEEYRPGKLLIK